MDAIPIPEPESHVRAKAAAKERSRLEWDGKSLEQRKQEAQSMLAEAAKALSSGSARMSKRREWSLPPIAELRLAAMAFAARRPLPTERVT
jgi:hypothetical protein